MKAMEATWKILGIFVIFINLINGFLQQSLFPGIPPTIKFGNPNETDFHTTAPEYLKPYLNWAPTLETSFALRRAHNSFLTKNGFQVSKNKTWIGLIGKYAFGHSSVKLSNVYKKYNHLPGAIELGNKVKLAENLKKAAMRFADDAEFQFVMESYSFPSDKEKIRQVMSENSNTYWIVKPAMGSRSKGVFITTEYKNLEELSNSTQYLIQRYLANPYLTRSNRTIQMRTYVLVTNVLPLRAYLNFGQYIAFGLGPFNLANINSCGLIYSEQNATACNSTVKSRFASFQSYFNEHFNITTEKSIKAQIEESAIKTIISVLPVWENQAVKKQFNTYNAFQLFSFDYLLDNNYKVCLLEVNTHPLFTMGIDYLMTDYLNLVGYQLPPTLPKSVIKKLEKELMRNNNKYGNSLQFNESLYLFPNKKNLVPNFQNMTSDVLKMLVIAEDELQRSKLTQNWHRIFPNENMRKYLLYMSKDSVNYKAGLVMADWEENYGNQQNRFQALNVLRTRLKNSTIL